MRVLLGLLLLVSCFVAAPLWARPPEDLIDFSKLELLQRKKPSWLKDNDLTFTNEDMEKKLKDPRVMKFRVDVEGRSYPSREGKALELFKKGAFAKVLFLSNDKRWLAVESIKTSKKRWVPRNTMPDFDEKLLTSEASKEEVKESSAEEAEL